MPCILSTPKVLVTMFWSLSRLGIELFRETFVFTYFFLCERTGPMRDQSSQFVPYFGLHVLGGMMICFQTIILRGVDFIVHLEDPIFQVHGFKNVVMLALLFDLEVDFKIFLLMIMIVKSILSNKLSFYPLKKPMC